MSSLVNRTGLRYGKLLVHSRLGSVGDHASWNCKCDCGASVLVSGGNLQSGHAKSCGCVGREKNSQRLTKHGYSIPRTSPDPLYSKWCMLRYSEGDQVPEAWNDFRTFLEDVLAIQPGWFPGRWLMRLDRAQPYSKENCVWANHQLRVKLLRRPSSLRLSLRARQAN